MAHREFCEAESSSNSERLNRFFLGRLNADQFASLVNRDLLRTAHPDVELIARVLAFTGSNQCTFVHQVN